MPSIQATLNSSAHGTSALSPVELRRLVRTGAFQESTAGTAAGYMQGNLVILPAEWAGDFLQFCVRNPKPCPLIGMSETGSPHIPGLGRDLDIRSDLPAYRVFRGGDAYERVGDLTSLWRDDLVSFVLGCSFTFEDAIRRAGIPVRHIEAGRNVPMYKTTLSTFPVGRFAAPMVVSMRAFKPADAIKAVLYSDRYPLAHGAPVHIGMPDAIGIEDLMKPDFGDPPVIEEGDIPVFWACGVTPQLAIRNIDVDLAITHEPGMMLVTDVLAEAESMPG